MEVTVGRRRWREIGPGPSVRQRNQSPLIAEPVLDRPNRRLDPRSQIELAQQVLDMHFHRAFGDLQLAGDQFVAEADGD